MTDSLNKHLYKSGNLKRSDPATHGNGGNGGGGGMQQSDDHTGFLKMTRSLQVRKSMVLSISHGPNGKLGGSDSGHHPHSIYHDGPMGVEGEMDRMLRSEIDYDDEGNDEDYHGSKKKSQHQSSSSSSSSEMNIERKNKKQNRNVNEEQHDLDLKVLQRMEQKLKFTRNPRHDPSNKNNHRLLTLPPAAPLIPSSTIVNTTSSFGQQALPMGGAQGQGGSEFKSMTGLMGPVSSPDTEQVMHQWENRKRPPPPGDHGFFVASPPIIEFTEYDVSGRYEAVVHVRNVTSVARSLTILPLATHFFAVAKVQFPSATQVSQTFILYSNSIIIIIIIIILNV
jgi:hypothetical protein